jgi:hypothetical protein
MELKKKLEEVLTVTVGCMLADVLLPTIKNTVKKLGERINTKKEEGK